MFIKRKPKIDSWNFCYFYLLVFERISIFTLTIQKCIYFHNQSKASYTYDKIGRRRVKATTAGSEKTKISCAFTASADGVKLPCLILIPRKKPLANFVCPDNVVIHYQQKKNTFTKEVLLLSYSIDAYFFTYLDTQNCIFFYSNSNRS